MALKEYAAYRNENKEPYYYDDFNDNNAGWLVVNDPYGEIKDGNLVLKNLDTIYYHIEKAIDDTKDFEIEFTAKFDKPKNAYAVFGWGNKSDSTDWGGFLVFRKDMVRVYNCANDTCEYLKQTSDGYVPPREGFSTYTIRKVDSFYYVFANEKFILTHPYKPLFGNGLTIQWGKSSLVFDNVTISYLKTPALDSSAPNFLPLNWGLQYFLKYNTRVDKSVLDGCLNTRFLVAARVQANGVVDSVISYSINKGLNYSTEQALLYSAGHWIPAYKNNQPVTGWFIKPINFYHGLPSTCLGGEFYYRAATEASVKGNTQEAFDNFLDAAKANYRNLNAWYNLVVICINEQKFGKAREYLNLLEIAATYKPDLNKDETDVMNSIPKLKAMLR